MVVDIHTHDIPLLFVETFLRKPPPGLGAHLEVRQGQDVVVHDEGYVYPLDPAFFDPHVKGEDMARRGIDVSVVSPSPTFFCYERDEGLAQEVAAALNDGTRELVAKSEGKLLGMAVVPLQSPRRALQELERVAKGHAFRAIEVGSHVAGRPLGDPLFRPFWRRVAELGYLVFVHPYYTGTKPGMERYYLTNLVGNPLDTTLAIASVVFSGLLEDIPDLRLLFAHAGGFAPYQRGRFRHGFQVRSEARAEARVSPEQQMARLYYDTITHDPEALAFLVRAVGARQVCLGSDLPFDMADPEPFEQVRRLGLPPEEEEWILGGNARRLLGLGG